MNPTAEAEEVAGVEVKADVTLGYWLRLTPGIGFAYGFDEDGEAQAYLRLDGFL